MNKKLRILLSTLGSIVILSEGVLIYNLNVKKIDNTNTINSLLNTNKVIKEELELKNNELELKNKDLEFKDNKIKELEDIINNLENEIEELSNAPLLRGISYDEIKVELTGYCNCYSCSENWNGITAMGTSTRVGVIAAPKNIEFGSQLIIPELMWYKSDGIFDVEDRGGAIQQKADGTYIIDVWFPTHEQALEFGRQTTTAYIIR